MSGAAADPPPEPLRGPLVLILTPFARDLPLRHRLRRLLKAAEDWGFRVDYRNPTLAELLGGEPED